MNLSKRSWVSELMDNEGDEDEIKTALRELKLINKLLGGNSVTNKALSLFAEKTGKSKFMILDAGSGGADIIDSAYISKMVTIDKNYFICTIVNREKKASAVCGDILEYPFRENSFEIIHASLFLHHFDEVQIERILMMLCRSAVFGVIINDLQRSYISYYGFKILASIFSRNRLVKNDGPVSISRGFNHKEISALLDATGKEYILKRKWAFRWMAIIFCNEKI